jgi:hypothetical protein
MMSAHAVVWDSPDQPGGSSWRQSGGAALADR